MNIELFETVVSAIKSSIPESVDFKIEPDTKFMEIPGLDSMSMVNFQMDLSETIGDKANEISPVFEMTIADYVALLES